MPHDHGGPGRGAGPTCRCPACEYELSLEEGQKCEMFECPNCGHKLVEKKE